MVGEQDVGRSRLFLAAGALMAISLTSFSGHDLAPEVPARPRYIQRSEKKTISASTEGEIKNIPTANQAILSALDDLRTLSPTVRPLVRYVWLTEGTLEDLKATAVVLNTVSRAPTTIRPMPVNQILARIHLDQYAPVSRTCSTGSSFGRTCSLIRL